MIVEQPQISGMMPLHSMYLHMTTEGHPHIVPLATGGNYFNCLTIPTPLKDPICFHLIVIILVVIIAMLCVYLAGIFFPCGNIISFPSHRITLDN